MNKDFSYVNWALLTIEIQKSSDNCLHYLIAFNSQGRKATNIAFAKYR